MKQKQKSEMDFLQARINRNQNQIVEKMKNLSVSYTPEWIFDKDNPDIGSAIALIYGKQLAQNREALDQILNRYHTEFVNLIDISVRPAKPSQSVVIMDLTQDTIEGTYVPKGTRLLASTGAAGSINVFETVENMYITGSRMNHIFMTNKEAASVIPILGEIKVPQILSSAAAAEEGENQIQDLEEDFIEYKPEEEKKRDLDFILFGKKEGVEKNLLLIYHSHIFDVGNNEIYIHFENAQHLIRDIEAGKKVFYYPVENELVRVEDVKLLPDGCTYALKRSQKEDVQQVGSNSYSLIVLKSETKIEEDIFADDVSISSRGEALCPEYIGSENTEYSADKFDLFTDNISLYQECYIGHSDYFEKAGAKMSLEFDLSFGEKLVNLTPQEEEAQLKIIKRRPRNIQNANPAEIYVDKISLEYFNGTGWRRLETTQDISEIFKNTESRHCKIDFVCPSDWETTVTGAYSGRSLRFQVISADNCYMRPSIHHYPVVNEPKVSFSYDNMYMKPDLLHAVCGTKKVDVYRFAEKKREKLTLFRVSEYTEDALYLGLDKKPASGPVSLFIVLNESLRYAPFPCKYEYSGRNGFKPLKVVADTKNLSKSGMVMFIPPEDFTEITLEGNRGYYIRMVRDSEPTEAEGSNELPHILDIQLNGVKVKNTEHLREENLYLDEVTKGARFLIHADNILEADVWVNEFGLLSDFEMKEFERKNPDNIRVETNMQGEVSAFFVKWKETTRFESETDPRSYMIDRISNELIFGDGINTYIPQVVNDVAVKIVATVSAGKAGNVPVGSIDTAMGNLMFIGSIYNPMEAYGGTDIESTEAALIRGANIISGRRRLVSMKDYVNEIKSFSELIDQVKGISGYNGVGEKQSGALTFLLLLKEHKDKSGTFHRIQEELKAHLLSCCEMTMNGEELYIAEPVFVEISVMAWVRAKRMQDSFEIQSRLQKIIAEYLSVGTKNANDDQVDLSGHFSIGQIPTVNQILQRINGYKENAIIRNIAITAKFTDVYGRHEVDLKELKVTPFMVVCSGQHKIHIEV